MLTANYLTYRAAATCYEAGLQTPHPIINRMIQPETILMLESLKDNLPMITLRAALTVEADDIVHHVINNSIAVMPVGQRDERIEWSLETMLSDLAKWGRVEDYRRLLAAIPKQWPLDCIIDIRGLPMKALTLPLLMSTFDKVHCEYHSDVLRLLFDYMEGPLDHKAELLIRLVQYITENLMEVDYMLFIDSETAAQLGPTYLTRLHNLNAEQLEIEDYLESYWLHFINYHGEEATVDEAKLRGIDPARMLDRHTIYRYQSSFAKLCEIQKIDGLMPIVLEQLLSPPPDGEVEDQLDQRVFPQLLGLAPIYQFYPKYREQICSFIDTLPVYLGIRFACLTLDASLWRRYTKDIPPLSVCHKLRTVYNYCCDVSKTERRRQFVLALSAEFLELLDRVNWQESLELNSGVRSIVLLEDLYHLELLSRSDLLKYVMKLIQVGGSSHPYGIHTTLLRLHSILILLSSNQRDTVVDLIRRWMTGRIAVGGGRIAMIALREYRQYPPDRFFLFCCSDSSLFQSGRVELLYEIAYYYALWSVDN